MYDVIFDIIVTSLLAHDLKRYINPLGLFSGSEGSNLLTKHITIFLHMYFVYFILFFCYLFHLI